MPRGRSGHRWRGLHAEQKAKRLPCWLCGQAIDYNLEWPDPQSFSVDHHPPLSINPAGAEDPACLRSSHLGCNSSRGNRDPKPGLGTNSRSW